MITIICLILAVISNYVSDIKGFKCRIKIKNLMKETLIADVIMILLLAVEGGLRQ